MSELPPLVVPPGWRVLSARGFHPKTGAHTSWALLVADAVERVHGEVVAVDVYPEHGQIYLHDAVVQVPSHLAMRIRNGDHFDCEAKRLAVENAAGLSPGRSFLWARDRIGASP